MAPWDFVLPRKAGDARRIKGKAREDGACGWLTVSNLADTFLEPC